MKIKRTVLLALAASMVMLASLLLLVEIGFGFTRGDVPNPPRSIYVGDRLSRAGIVTFVCFGMAEIGTTWLIIKSGLVPTPRRWVVLRPAGVFVAAILCTYVLTLLSFALLNSRPVPALRNTERFLAKWIMTIAG